MDRNGFHLALDHDRRQGHALARRFDVFPSFVVDEDFTALCDGAQARGEVDGVADNGIAHRLRGAHVAGDHNTRGDADPDLDGWEQCFFAFEIERFHGLDHGECRVDGSRGMVGLRNVDAPDRHDFVADEFIDDAIAGKYAIDHRFEVVVEHIDNSLWFVLFGHLRKPADIGE